MRTQAGGEAGGEAPLCDELGLCHQGRGAAEGGPINPGGALPVMGDRAVAVAHVDVLNSNLAVDELDS